MTNMQDQNPEQRPPKQPGEQPDRPSSAESEVVLVQDGEGNLYAIERYIMERTRVHENHRADIEQVLNGKDASHGAFSLARQASSFKVAGVLRFRPSRGLTIANALRDL